ncbi:2-polyprenyl-6-hydroxyphenol methylase [Lentibacillus sp. JNUCC-1]|nr:2-polyprenyl-6-hydroxyphenol methylase [Lentibacillus sp. JNUCC-1]
MAYEQMASVYDTLMEEAPYGNWVAFTKALFSHETSEVKNVIDLGCGTGKITTGLAASGYNMTGVDFSSAMLSQADQHAQMANVNINWICQDLRELNIGFEMDAAVSYCDVMNYITTEKELLHVFQNTSEILKPGGLFVFDVHSLFHVEQHCINQTFADVTDSASYIWFCLEGEEAGEMYHDLTFFKKSGDVYKKFTELHHQRTFPVKVYKNLLKQSGFHFCHLYGDFSLKSNNVTDETERFFIVARKQAGK